MKDFDLSTFNIHVDYIASDNCQCLEITHGEVCVKCGKCGRVFENGLLVEDIKNESINSD